MDNDDDISYIQNDDGVVHALTDHGVFDLRMGTAPTQDSEPELDDIDLFEWASGLETALFHADYMISES